MLIFKEKICKENFVNKMLQTIYNFWCVIRILFIHTTYLRATKLNPTVLPSIYQNWMKASFFHLSFGRSQWMYGKKLHWRTHWRITIFCHKNQKSKSKSIAPFCGTSFTDSFCMSKIPSRIRNIKHKIKIRLLSPIIGK